MERYPAIIFNFQPFEVSRQILLTSTLIMFGLLAWTAVVLSRRPVRTIFGSLAMLRLVTLCFRKRIFQLGDPRLQRLGVR